MKFLPIVALSVLCAMPYAATITPKTPAKSSAGCYVISDAAELYGFAAIVNGTDGSDAEKSACATLAKDIVVNENVLNEDGTLNKEASADFVPWTPIDLFSGKFDGMGHTISGLFYDNSEEQEEQSFGFFRSLVGSSDKYAELSNFGVVDSYLGANTYYVGVVVGELIYPSSKELVPHAKISNVYSTSTIYSYYQSFSVMGGLVGGIFKGNIEIENCYNAGSVFGVGFQKAGGLVGYIDDEVNLVKISNSFSVWNPASEKLEGLSPLIGSHYGAKIAVDNTYYLNLDGSQDLGDSATTGQFQNGAVAVALHEGVNGSVWGQNVGVDRLPNFSGEVKNSASQKYKVTFHTFEGDTAIYFDSYISGLRKALPTEVIKENMTFCCWSTSPEFKDENLVFYIDSTESGDKEYWAYLLNNYPITFHTNGGTIEDGEIDQYIERYGVNLPVKVSRDSFFFAGWYENEDLSGTPVYAIDATEKGAKTFYASWFKLKMPEVDADSCFAISDAAELYGFAAYVNGAHGMHDGRVGNVCAKLTQDIVVNENVIKNGKLNTADTAKFLVWEPIAEFTGTFDGRGHTITGIYCGGVSAVDDYPGFIRTVSGYGNSTGYAVIKNLRIAMSYYIGDVSIGGFVGWIRDPEKHYPVYGSEYTVPGGELVIENCSFDGVLNGQNTTGGLVGRASNKLTIRNSSVSGSIEGFRVGGLVGVGGDLTIYDSHNAAGLTGFEVGGLVGELGIGISVIDNCFNTGDVYAKHSAGGLIGETTSLQGYIDGYVTSHLTLMRSFNTGSVSSEIFVAGLIGLSRHNLLVANNYNLGKVSGETPVGLVRVSSCGSYLDSIYIVNNYNMGILFSEAGRTMEPAVWNLCASVQQVKAENNYYLQNASDPYTSKFGLPATAAEFKDSTVANVLHAYAKSSDDILKEDITGDVWTQGKDYPILAVPKSSSSSVVSSSSVAKSSSSIASSSSDAKSSSSEAKSSSSECKGDKCKESLPELATVPSFRVSVIGHELQVAGAHVGASFALLDMQGRVLRKGTVDESNFSVMVPRSGGYLVRIGDDVRRVIVR